MREFETSGTYFIRVRYDTGTSTGDYRLRVTDEGLDDSGDTFDAATFVPANDISVSGRLETPGDVDWYEFDVEAEHIYEIVAYESSVDLELRLYDSNETTLITTVDPNSSSTNTLRIRREFETSGTYYIKINQDYSSSSYYGANIGDYTVTIDDQGLDNAPVIALPLLLYWQRIAPIPDALKPQKIQTGMRLRRKPVMFIESGHLRDQI